MGSLSKHLFIRQPKSRHLNFSISALSRAFNKHQHERLLWVHTVLHTFPSLAGYSKLVADHASETLSQQVDPTPIAICLAGAVRSLHHHKETNTTFSHRKHYQSCTLGNRRCPTQHIYLLSVRLIVKRSSKRRLFASICILGTATRLVLNHGAIAENAVCFHREICGNCLRRRRLCLI